MLGVKKLGYPITPIFDIYVEFLDLLFLDKFIIVLLTLLPPSSSTSLLLALNIFEADFNDSIVFNKEISSTASLLKL